MMFLTLSPLLIATDWKLLLLYYAKFKFKSKNKAGYFLDYCSEIFCSVVFCPAIRLLNLIECHTKTEFHLLITYL